MIERKLSYYECNSIPRFRVFMCFANLWNIHKGFQITWLKPDLKANVPVFPKDRIQSKEIRFQC